MKLSFYGGASEIGGKMKNILNITSQLGTDSNKIISMMNKHAAEIKELYDKKDKHFAVETGDLIILCLQLLMREGYNVDKVMDRCYERFERKYGELDGT